MRLGCPHLANCRPSNLERAAIVVVVGAAVAAAAAAAVAISTIGVVAAAITGENDVDDKQKGHIALAKKTASGSNEIRSIHFRWVV